MAQAVLLQPMDRLRAFTTAQLTNHMHCVDFLRHNEEEKEKCTLQKAYLKACQGTR